MLEKRTETQGQMIRKFQTLIANEGLFSQIIDFFPYPIAIFTPQYTVVMVNKAFAAETKTRFIKLEKGAVRILQHKIDDMRLATAVKRVFAGDTFFLSWSSRSGMMIRPTRCGWKGIKTALLIFCLNTARRRTGMRRSITMRRL